MRALPMTHDPVTVQVWRARLEPGDDHREIVRSVLAHCLGTDPAQIHVGPGAGGKPVLLRPVSELRFNISHSGGRLVVAVGRRIEVGVDIELNRPLPDPGLVADTILSGPERAAAAGLGRSELVALLWRAWTRKEAMLKALGVGLSQPPAGMAVELDAVPAPAHGRSRPLRHGAPWPWTLYDIGAGLRDAEVSAALATAGPARVVHRLWESGRVSSPLGQVAGRVALLPS